jgi:hypothetical protein
MRLTDPRRAAVLAEAESWIGTPYHHAARVKGVGCDCLTLLAEVYPAARIIGHVEVPFYPPDWHLHRSAELYLDGVVAREHVKRRAIGTPDRHAKGTPLWYWFRLVPVANRRDPRASRSAPTSDEATRAGGTCLPTGASRGGTAAQARCLKRQLSLPVSMISQ